MSEWINVDERLPDEGQEVLAYGVSDSIYRGYEMHHILQYSGGDFVDHQNYTTSVTHWQPLPPPPKEAES